MRTRRSPRNQEILWRELGGQLAPKPAPLPPKTDAEIDAIPFLSQRTRNILKREAASERFKAAKKRAIGDRGHP